MVCMSKYVNVAEIKQTRLGSGQPVLTVSDLHIPIDGRLRCSFVCQGASISSLWQEYEDGQTPEAKLVKDFDKVVCLIMLCGVACLPKLYIPCQCVCSLRSLAHQLDVLSILMSSTEKM